MSNDKFEKWWAGHGAKDEAMRLLRGKELARVGWNAHADRFAALTPEVIETLIEACNRASADYPAYAAQIRQSGFTPYPDRFAAARAALESVKP